MSVLDQQLKELQQRKLKVEFFKHIKGKIGDVSNQTFKDVEKEVKDQVFAFIDAQVDMIEGGEIETKEEVSNVFSDEQVKALVLLANKVANRAPEQSNPYSQEPTSPPPQAPINNSTQDKISFALSHRHLDGKEVKVKSQGGSTGVVVGLDAPNIVISLTNGTTVAVPPGDLIV